MTLLDHEPGKSSSTRAPGRTAERARRTPRRRRTRRRLVVALLGLGLLLGIPGGAGLIAAQHLNGQVSRMPGVFDGLTGRPSRPTSGAAAGAMNILLLGSDRRTEVPTTGSVAETGAWAAGEQRSDTMMVLHIDADRDGASVVSIPRDSWVEVPGYGSAKINAAFSIGGPRLAVATVERLTGVRIDHVAMVDWDGYQALIDVLGGVDVRVPVTVHDSYRHHTWTAGRHHLNGAGALLYARERSGLPGGDLDRVKRQQAVLRALSNDALTAIANPATAYELLDSLTQHLSVDETWSAADMGRLVLSLRHLGSSDVDYLTVPVTGTGRVGDQSVVFVDEAAGKKLWQAVRRDRMARWTADNGDLLTGATVR